MQSCMLTHPFDARNQCALIMKIVQAQMSPIADHVPPELRNLIIWALQKDPKDRPKIKHILNDVSIQAFITLYSVYDTDQYFYACRDMSEKNSLNTIWTCLRNWLVINSPTVLLYNLLPMRRNLSLRKLLQRYEVQAPRQGSQWIGDALSSPRL